MPDDNRHSCRGLTRGGRVGAGGQAVHRPNCGAPGDGGDGGRAEWAPGATGAGERGDQPVQGAARVERGPTQGGIEGAPWELPESDWTVKVRMVMMT